MWLEWEMVCTAEAINLKINTRGDYRPAWDALKVTLPADEKRQLLINGEAVSEWVRK